MLNGEDVEQVEVVNNLLLDMVKNQRENNKNMVKVFITSIICLTIILLCGIFGFFYYESQFDYTTSETTTKTITQEISGTDSEINNVDRDMDKDDYGRMYTGKNITKYGYSYDEYMNERKVHPGMDEGSKKMRMDKLDDYLNNLLEMGKNVVKDMSPDEKQQWRTGITKLLNV